MLTNLLLAFIIYMMCRGIYLCENFGLLGNGLSASSLVKILKGGAMFDISALCYLNSLYILLTLLPLHLKERHGYYRVVKWAAFVVPNSMAVIANMTDAVLYPFRFNRVTALIFKEFGGEDNLLSIFGIEIINHWYIVVAAIAMIAAMIWLYRRPEPSPMRGWRYYALYGSLLVMAGVMVPTGMRGASFLTSTRPISINEAHRFVDRPAQVAIVLNTPFSIIRTLNQTPRAIPQYFADDELDTIYTPVHMPADSAVFRPRNVVILIVESFAEEFVGSRNRDLDGGLYTGYTPFADSLLSVSLTYEHTFANGAFSIDAMPALLASIPRMEHPFVLTPFSMNPITTLATELGSKGYSSAFYHGATNYSLGFNAFAAHAGYDRYCGMDEYVADSRFGGRGDYDGTWGIWDEEFLQFFCKGLSTMKEPFLGTVFTVSSHHPFAIPDRYRDTFPDEGKYPLHKCIRYTDYALRRFFDEASRQPWYANTIFVLSADHASSKVTHDVYHTELGRFRIPILFFDPSGRMPRGCRPGIAQQIDVMPTLLDYLGYDKPYIAFGKSLLRDGAVNDWAFNWDNVEQYILGDYLMQLNGDEVTAIYNYRSDPLLRNNLKGRCQAEAEMERRVKALEQSFMQRGNEARLSIDKK